VTEKERTPPVGGTAKSALVEMIPRVRELVADYDAANCAAGVRAV